MQHLSFLVQAATLELTCHICLLFPHIMQTARTGAAGEDSHPTGSLKNARVIASCGSCGAAGSRAMGELPHGRRRKRVRARSFLGAAAISASLTPACAFLTHPHQHCCRGPSARPPQRANTPQTTRNTARESSSLQRVWRLPAHTEEKIDWRFKPLKWPPLVRSAKRGSDTGGGTGKPETTQSGRGSGDSADVPRLGLANQSKPNEYQAELFRLIVECERNSLVYLPTGSAGKTVVASMVLRRLLELNPGRQAFFLVETTALAVQQVRALRCAATAFPRPPQAGCWWAGPPATPTSCPVSKVVPVTHVKGTFLNTSLIAITPRRRDTAP